MWYWIDHAYYIILSCCHGYCCQFDTVMPGPNLDTYFFNVSFADLLTGFLPFLWTCDELTWRFRRQKGRFVFFCLVTNASTDIAFEKNNPVDCPLIVSTQNPYQKIEKHIFYSVCGLSGIVLSTFNVCSFVRRMMFHQCASSKHVSWVVNSI